MALVIWKTEREERGMRWTAGEQSVMCLLAGREKKQGDVQSRGRGEGGKYNG